MLRQNCETKELIFNLRTFPIGITFSEFKGIAKQNKLNSSETWRQGDKLFYEISNIFLNVLFQEDLIVESLLNFKRAF